MVRPLECSACDAEPALSLRQSSSIQSCCRRHQSHLGFVQKSGTEAFFTSGISLLSDGQAVSVQQMLGAVVLACRSTERGEKLRQDLLDEGAKQGRTPSLEVSLKLPFPFFCCIESLDWAAVVKGPQILRPRKTC